MMFMFSMGMTFNISSMQSAMFLSAQKPEIVYASRLPLFSYLISLVGILVLKSLEEVLNAQSVVAHIQNDLGTCSLFFLHTLFFVLPTGMSSSSKRQMGLV